jgi:hypothetical protein
MLFGQLISNFFKAIFPFALKKFASGQGRDFSALFPQLETFSFARGLAPVVQWSA